jgi:GGDEF domain-containing protein
MAKLNRAELDRLERRELQLTILSAVFVLVLAAGLAAFMYPLVFENPVGNKWTLRVVFFGFCGLVILFVGYLVDRQGMVRKLKQQLLEELERNVELRHQASVDLLQSMPDINHFWDRLTMEFRRAAATEKTLSLLLVKAKAGHGTEAASEDSAAWGDTAKALSRKLRPTDSIYRLTTDLFALVLPETDPVNAQRVALRLEEELQVVRAKFGSTYEINCYNYPQQVQSAHELEDIVRSLLPEQPGWDIPVPLASN